MIIVDVLDNSVEASILTSILEERNIPHLVQSFQDSAYANIYQSQNGWGRVLAPLEWKQEIINILSELRKEEDLDKKD